VNPVQTGHSAFPFFLLWDESALMFHLSSPKVPVTRGSPVTFVIGPDPSQAQPVVSWKGLVKGCVRRCCDILWDCHAWPPALKDKVTGAGQSPSSPLFLHVNACIMYSSCDPACAHTRAHTRTHARTHTHTRARTHTRSPSRQVSVPSLETCSCSLCLSSLPVLVS
jgi:hypothetical protein